MTPERPDSLLASLSDLTPLAPTAALDERIRSRCHAAMAPATRKPCPITQVTIRAIDRLLPVAVVLYVVVILVEGLRAAGVW